MWPFSRRPLTIVVSHQISCPELKELAAAIRYAADAQANRLPAPTSDRADAAPAKPDVGREEFIAWLDSKPWDAVKRGDFIGMFEHFTGRRKGTPAQKERAVRVLTIAGAPLPQPVG
jgi:hypothetical protein